MPCSSRPVARTRAFCCRTVHGGPYSQTARLVFVGELNIYIYVLIVMKLTENHAMSAPARGAADTLYAGIGGSLDAARSLVMEMVNW